MALTLLHLDLILAISVIYLLLRLVARKRHALPLPPGPEGYPIIGNVLEMPHSHEWFTFARWSEKYGDIFSLNLLGQPLVVLGSYEHAMNLLDKRSSIYCDRPILTMGGELVGWKKILVLVRPGERFREYRRLMNRLVGGKTAVQQQYDLQRRQTHMYLRSVLQDPDNLPDHIRLNAGSVILMVTHGYPVQGGDDPIIEVVDRATTQFAMVTSPGAFLVDVFPILRHVPSWFPGASFKRKAAEWNRTINEMADMPHEFTKSQMRKGIHVPSYTSILMETEENTPDKEEHIKWSAASIYAAGADTTVSAIYAFYLAMALYPEVQSKAQEEIDWVVGSDRLPDFSDRESLPYVEALLKEVLRWFTTGPLAVPHVTTEDDVYQGYCIPKGTYVIANVWKMLHDPRTYPDPMMFNPERFLGDHPQQDPAQMAFGFGRRICPGQVMADASLFISIAMSLSVFNVSKAKDEQGNVITPIPESTSGTISHPKPFKCSITPRNSKAEALILSDPETKS
ncbi:cytochrome P450 family protein [Abortiporus biennis]